MKNLRFIIWSFFSFFLLMCNSYAQQDKKNTDANGSSAEAGFRLMINSGGGSSSVSGSPLFTGHTSSTSAPEFFLRVRPSNFSSLSENFAIEGNISMAKSVHEIKFVGASLGKKTCSQAVGLTAQWWFGENTNTVRPYLGAGFEHRSCSGEYAVGGARFTQSESSANSAVFRAGVKFDLSDIVAKGLAASVDLKTSGKHTSSGTPIPGNTISNKDGGGVSGGFGLQYSF